MVSINGYGFPLKGYGFPLHGNGFPLQSNFGQNLKSCFLTKIWNFLEKFLRCFSNYIFREQLYAVETQNFFLEYF
jgi:hypothetical protein